MQKYEIISILANGYERFVTLKCVDCDLLLCAHFIEYSEYLDYGEETNISKVGDIVEGKLYIDLVSYVRETNNVVSYSQNIKGSSHIELVVVIKEFIDEYSVMAYSNITDELIKVEFESQINLQIESKVYIIGSLEFEGV